MTSHSVALAEICASYQIQILYAFGSRAREVNAWLDGSEAGLAAGPSDVDIGAKPPRGVTSLG